jgi:hypothetical protein
MPTATPKRSKAARRPKPEANTYGLPTGEPIRKALREVFRSQRNACLKALGVSPKASKRARTGQGRNSLAFRLATKDEGVPASDPASFDFPDLGPGLLDMAKRMTPLLAVYWEQGGEELRSRIGLDPNAWSVTNPHLRRMIEQAALDFCAATNATTSLQLNEAKSKLREELTAGVVDRGESVAALTKRVNKIFDTAETWRARRIAATEASRAVHAAQEEAAKQSGIVAGWEWLLSSDACPLCHRIVAEAGKVRLGQAFAVIGDHPTYSQIRMPPGHPGCQCTAVPILTPSYGGPEDPQWSSTLDQPEA